MRNVSKSTPQQLARAASDGRLRMRFLDGRRGTHGAFGASDYAGYFTVSTGTLGVAVSWAKATLDEMAIVELFEIDPPAASVNEADALPKDVPQEPAASPFFFDNDNDADNDVEPAR